MSARWSPNCPAFGKLPLLENPQELAWSSSGSSPISSKNKVLPGPVRSADAALDGSGEGATDMAEEFGFQKVIGQGAAMTATQGHGAWGRPGAGRSGNLLASAVSPVMRTVARRRHHTDHVADVTVRADPTEDVSQSSDTWFRPPESPLAGPVLDKRD